MEFEPDVGGTFFQVSYEAILVQNKSINGGSNVPVKEMVIWCIKVNYCILELQK